MNDLTAEIFEFFIDGHWHSLRDVQERFNVDLSTADRVVRFLASYRLLRLSSSGSEAIIDPTVLQILESGAQRDDFMREITQKLKRNGQY